MNIKFIKITPNVYLSDDPNFRTLDINLFSSLIIQVQKQFAEWIRINIYNTCNCYITYQEAHPSIYPLADGHNIALYTNNQPFPDWVRQFAHEYCHHLFNGKMQGFVKGLMWLEEGICDVAAFQQMKVLEKTLDSAIGYHDEMYHSNLQACNQIFFHKSKNTWKEYSQSHKDEVAAPLHNREGHECLVSSLIPLFEVNFSLWKMVCQCGDMREWDSLSSLFDHLEETADDSYSVSLSKLRNLLL